MKSGRSCVLLMVALGLLVVAGFLGWRGQERQEAEGGSSKIRGGYSGEASNGDGTELVRSQRSKRGRDSGQVSYTFEETVAFLQESAKKRAERPGEFLKVVDSMPVERWALLIQELEKDNPPMGSRDCVIHWAKVDPEALLEFLRAKRFQFSTSGWKASMELVKHFAPKDSELAITLYGEWEESHNVDVDRDSWSRPMVENIASQERHSSEEKFEAWFKGLAEREQGWALEVAPVNSIIR